MKCSRCDKEALFVSPNLCLCESCLEKHFNASLLEMERRGLIERHGENWRITEKGKLEETSWDEAWDEAKPSVCNKCGRQEVIGCWFRTKYYCHECFRPIADMVNEADEAYKKPLKGDDHVFWPSADEETRGIMVSWTLADLFIKIDRRDIAYAWLKTGVIHPEIVDSYRKFFGGTPLPSRLTKEEVDQWDEAIKEYAALDVRREEKIPQAEQWALVYKLENGETCVADRHSHIDVVGHEEAKHYVKIFSALKHKGSVAYTKEGDRGSVELLGDKAIRAVDCQAVSRTDYDPRKHDRLHLRLGPTNKNEATKRTLEAMQALGIFVDLESPGTAFDVMDRLYRLCETTKAYDILGILRQAHPIVWTPQMTMTAYQAVCELAEPLMVETDLMFINPSLWLFTFPCYEGCPAERAVEPFTEDGHIPFPDELVGDLGAPVVSILFNLTETEIRARYFYLLRETPAKLEIRSSLLKLGAQPSRIEQQTTLKWLRFAASPYLIVSQHHVERHIRRRVESRFPQVTSGVGVILLRRVEKIYEARGHGSGEEINWSCQWWVSGHWRRQWYPSTMTHKPIWVAPYIKGPPDKPLKESVRLMVR